MKKLLGIVVLGLLLSVNSKADIIGKKFLYLNGTAGNSGDIHTNGGDDGIAVIQK